MWADLGYCHFLYVQAVLHIATHKNGTATKNVLKWNHALGFEFSIQPSVYGTTTVEKSKPIFHLDTVYCKVLLYVSIEIDLFTCEQTSAI